ncbi:MAG: ABC transporter ATP-binding protein [Nitrososphaerota archaeon]
MVAVTLETLTKYFGENLAVDNVNLEIKDKEFFVLLGPSGCGKSTTLNMIAGLEYPTSGKIYFDHELVNNLPPEKRDVAMVFQSFALYPTMNVYQNIAFPLTLRKVPKGEIGRKVRETAALLRIEHLLGKKPYELSGGEKQRVALARAVIRQPKLFLLDEPLSNIDAKLRVYMRAELIRLQKDIQTTTIYVTHDQVEAMTMGDRIAVMNNGKIMQTGPPMEVFRKPSNLFVAGFIGTPPMNFFECSLLRTSDGKHFLDGRYFKIGIDENTYDMLMRDVPSGNVIIGVRPHDLKIMDERERLGVFEAEIFAVEPLGTETVVDLQAGGEIYKAVMGSSFSGRIGERVHVMIPWDRVHLFEKKTGRAIL